jgi:hypothetical protein
MSGAIAAAIIASSVGFGVYQSCTKHAASRRAALIIDAIAAALMIAGFHWQGFL